MLTLFWANETRGNVLLDELRDFGDLILDDLFLVETVEIKLAALDYCARIENARRSLLMMKRYQVVGSY